MRRQYLKWDVPCMGRALGEASRRAERQVAWKFDSKDADFISVTAWLETLSGEPSVIKGVVDAAGFEAHYAEEDGAAQLLGAPILDAEPDGPSGRVGLEASSFATVGLEEDCPHALVRPRATTIWSPARGARSKMEDMKFLQRIDRAPSSQREEATVFRSRHR